MREGHESSHNPEEEVQKQLAMHHRDIADHYEGMRTMDKQSLMEAEEAIKSLEEQLENLEKTN